MLKFPCTTYSIAEGAISQVNHTVQAQAWTALTGQIAGLDSTLNVELQRFSGCAGVEELSGGGGFLSGASSWRAFAAAFLLCSLWAPESPAPPILWNSEEEEEEEKEGPCSSDSYSEPERQELHLMAIGRILLPVPPTLHSC